ncbi:MAG: M14 family zinc carboxypeptidase [bacterium]|nr:M14 family zinc carboxypeptidase [bacterium]
MGSKDQRSELLSPEAYLGHPVGADYKVANWEKIRGYFAHVAEHSDRVNVRELGKTTEGRPYVVAEISSAENLRDRNRHLEDRKKVADPRLIRDGAEERSLIEDGKVVVYFGCAIHGNEVGATQMSLELLYELASGTSAEIQEILDRVILVMVPSSDPDGLDNVIAWYEQTLGKAWEGSGMPWIYNTYAGNQNVWDTVHLNLNESRMDARLLYQEWLPNIMGDVHQWGSSSARLLVPPHSDPTNVNLHPLHNQLLYIVGGFMQAELIQAGKTGVRSGYQYSTYESGIPRYTASRHNMVSFLTEAASCRVATPLFLTRRQLDSDHDEVTTQNPLPWPGGWWRLRDIVEYEKIGYRAVLKAAARNHELFQQASIRAGRDAIRKGQEEPPFAWLVPEAQHDPGRAAHMLELLHFSGVEVHQAEEAFVADEVSYPAGTFVMYAAQPFRTYVKDLLERQDPPTGPTPNRFEGWTLPLQMGVRWVTVNGTFECRTEKLMEIPRPEGKVQSGERTTGYVVSVGANDDYKLINRLHKTEVPFQLISSGEVWASEAGERVPDGSLFVPGDEGVRKRLPELVEGVGVTLCGTDVVRARVEANLNAVSSPRTGVYRPWMENLDEGWTRFVLEAFEFPYTAVHNAGIRAGNLKERFDCLVLPSMSTAEALEGQRPEATAPRYAGGIGQDGATCLQDFVREGGTLVCIDEACNLPMDLFGIPVKNILYGLPQETFFCRGSSLRIQVDTSHPVGYGMQAWMSAYFYEAQAFEVCGPEATVVARYADTGLVESGRIRSGEALISGKPAIVDVAYGKGHIVLLGFRVQRNAQTHGTYRFLFNAIQRSTLGVERG